MAKRKRDGTQTVGGAKKLKKGSVQPKHDHSSEDGDVSHEMWNDWPAPKEDMEAARGFLKGCVADRLYTLIVPDKDADGLSSGLILYKTLTFLGQPRDLIGVHILKKGNSVHSEEEGELMSKRIRDALANNTSSTHARVVVVDQGSRGGPAIVPSSLASDTKDPTTKIHVKTLVIDHHMSDEFPEGALALSASRSPPIATSSMLTFLTCMPLHPSVRQHCDWIAILGVFGDLGQNEVTWDDNPWPRYIGDTIKAYGKKTLGDAVGALNAPRRTAEYDVEGAWRILLSSKHPTEIATNPTFRIARSRTNDEVERCTHVPPKFSKDGRVALLTIASGFQVHPVIATRWAGFLKSKKLIMVMVANTAYHPSKKFTNFSCRIVAAMRKLPEAERPNLIEILKEYGRRVEENVEGGAGFFERVGGDFAKGHKEATGGIISTEDFSLFCQGMEIGLKDENASPSPNKGRKKPIDPGQKNSLHDFFGKSPRKKEDA